MADQRDEGAPFPPFEPGASSRMPVAAPASPRLTDIPLRVLVPNLITIGAICAGLTGVRLAFDGRFGLAVAFVLAAAFLDAIDGRVARLLKASTRFGEQMDSLADVVNFGVAPALVAYAYLLHEVSGIGWMAALVYAIATTLRLARFNVMLDEQPQGAWQRDFFTGVPAPAGGGLVLLPVYIGLMGVEVTPFLALLGAAYTMLVALLLVSSLPVYSGKTSSARVPRKWVVPLMLLLVGYVVLLLSYEWVTLTVTALAYLAFLPFSARMYRRRARGG